MAHTTCLVCFISTVNDRIKKKKKRSLGSLALVAGTKQTLSDLFLSFDIYGFNPQIQTITSHRFWRPFHTYKSFGKQPFSAHSRSLSMIN
jgi:hypothetical protein